MRIGTPQHEKKLQEVIQTLEKKGAQVVDLKGFSPDAVAIIDGKLVAIEVLQVNYRKQGNSRYLRSRWTEKGKRAQYSMFDDVIIETFVREET